MLTEACVKKKKDADKRKCALNKIISFFKLKLDKPLEPQLNQLGTMDAKERTLIQEFLHTCILSSFDFFFYMINT